MAITEKQMKENLAQARGGAPLYKHLSPKQRDVIKNQMALGVSKKKLCALLSVDYKGLKTLIQGGCL